MLNLFKFFVTTADPTVSELSTESIGGYSSRYQAANPDSLFDFIRLGKNIEPDTSEIPISSSPPITEGLISVGPEIMFFSGYDSTSSVLTGITRGQFPKWNFGNNFKTNIYFLPTDSLFSNTVNFLTEYRCIAVQFNSGSSGISSLDKIAINFYQDTTSMAQIDFGIEVPKHNFISGVLAFDSTDSTSVLTNDLSGYEDDFFINSHININGTFDAIITSFSSSTGKITFSSTAPFEMTSGMSYSIFDAPTQILAEDSIPPSKSNGRFFGFYSDTGINNPGYNNIRVGGNTFLDTNLFYLWIKRTITENQKQSSDEGLVITIEYESPVDRLSLNYPDLYDLRSYTSENIVVLTGKILKNNEPVSGITAHTTYNSITYSSISDNFGMYLLEVPITGSGTITLALQSVFSPSPSSISWSGSNGNQQQLDFSLNQLAQEGTDI